MNRDVIALLLTAALTAGCVTIHELRAHATAMTPALGSVAICFGVLVVLVALAGEQPERDKGTARPTKGTVVQVPANPPASRH